MNISESIDITYRINKKRKAIFVVFDHSFQEEKNQSFLILSRINNRKKRKSNLIKKNSDTYYSKKEEEEDVEADKTTKTNIQRTIRNMCVVILLAFFF